MLYPQNAQDFIRALKAATDPPHVDSPPKIDIARHAWDDAHLYVPNKAEAVVDWLLSRLLKDRSKDRHDNPICDSRYWSLLADILCNSNAAAKVDDRGHALRAWLIPLLNRIPIAPILLSYFELLSTSAQIDSSQSTLALKCIAILWPLAVPKINPETLLECFGAVVQLGVSPDVSDLSCERILALAGLPALSAIVSSYRAFLANAAAKRKQLYGLFLKRNFTCWLRVISWSLEDGRGIPSLVSDIYDAGIETIFGLEVIKQSADHKHDTTLSEALQAASREHSVVVLRCIPRLFESYVYNVKRLRGALFSQSSNQAPGHITEQVQRASMAFYASCVALARFEEVGLSWKSRVLLLGIVEKENLLNPRDDEAQMLLRQDGDLAVKALASAWDDQHAERTESAVQLLATLTRIDYDLMAMSLEVVYPRIMAIPGQTPSTLQYLRLIIDYESRARTLPSALLRLTEAFSPQHLQRIPGGPQASYQIVSAGPLASLLFLDELSKVVQNFLTPSQVLEAVNNALHTLTDAYERFAERAMKASADRGDGPRKRRKKDTVMGEDLSELEYYASSFSLIARTLVTVLRAVPLHIVTEDVRAEVVDCIGKMYSEVAIRGLRDGLKRDDRREAWPWQVATIGALRLQYGLSLSHFMDRTLDEELASTMLSCVASEDTIPELVVEMVRTLMHQCSLGVLDPVRVLDIVLQYLEVHLPRDRTGWTGRAHSMETHELGAIAILHLLVDRWLPNVDAWASPSQLERLGSVLVNIDQNPQQEAIITVKSILRKMLHDAQFWELLKIRDAFIAQLNEQTATLDSADLSQLLSSHSSQNVPVNDLPFVSIGATYEILVLTPPEYLPRAMHSQFLKRGFAADICLSLAGGNSANSAATHRRLLAIREVLRRTIAHLGTAEQTLPKEYLDHVLDHDRKAYDPGVPGEELTSVTMDLIDMYQRSLIRAAKRGSTEPVVGLVRRFTRAFSEWDANTTMRASLLFVDAVVQDFSAADFPDLFSGALRTLYEVMLDACIPRLSSETFDNEATLDHMLLDSWSHLQTLGRWLKVDAGSATVIGKQLAKTVLSRSGKLASSESLAPVVMSILLGELQNGDRTGHVEHLLVAYISFARHCDEKGMTNLESRLTSACRTLPTEVFASILDLVFDGLPLDRGLPAQDVSSLIRFSTAVLRDAPEGTSKICQGHITRCLNVFADNELFTSSPALRTEVLNFLVRQCSDRPAALRTVDLSSLWSLLRALAAGAAEHEQATDSAVFHGIVNVLSALVRLRRDLVLNNLPHLGFVLRRLFSSLRTMRPQLGGKQSRLVMNTLPRWISPTEPLSSQESKALARLLTTLTTKTMIRTHGPAAETQKPESLVRPFSKHAAYVLTAYVEAVNDPLCTVPLAIRKELQPGLFALCDMLGEHNRDAMMVSALDAGGKATMKVLWRDYEKQRYVGKG